MTQYQRRDPRALEPHFTKHVAAMTSEDLHEKADIAQELAARDQRIEALEALLERLGACPACGGIPIHDLTEPFSHCGCGSQEDHATRPLQKAQWQATRIQELEAKVAAESRRANLENDHLHRSLDGKEQLRAERNQTVLEWGRAVRERDALHADLERVRAKARELALDVREANTMTGNEQSRNLRRIDRELVLLGAESGPGNAPEEER